jgi:hypothetical protein
LEAVIYIVFNLYQLYPDIRWIRCPAFETLSYTRKSDVLDFRHLRPLRYTRKSDILDFRHFRPLSYTRKSDVLDFRHFRPLRYTRKSDVLDFRYVLPMSYTRWWSFATATTPSTYVRKSEVLDFRKLTSLDVYMFFMIGRAELYTRTKTWMSLISDIYCADSCIEYLIHLLKTGTFSPKKGSPNGGLTLIQLAKSPIMGRNGPVSFEMDAPYF